MNILIEKLNKVLKDYNLCCVVKKETMTLLHCYLYELDDYKELGKNIKDYTGCKKYDVTFKKQELCTYIANKALGFLSKTLRQNYDVADKLGMLRK